MAYESEGRSVEGFTTLDSFLEEEGILEEVHAAAIKEVVAWQLQQAMKAEGLSQVALAKRMKTSPAQVRRLLNPKDGNVTLATLQKAAEMVGRKVRLELI